MTSQDLKAQSHAKLQDLMDLSIRLDDLADRAAAAGHATLVRVIEREQERISRWRRARIDAHVKVWGWC